MAFTADKVVVELEARLGRYEANVASAERKFDRAMGGIQKSAGRTEAIVSRAMGGISAALAGVSVGALARTFLDIADSAKKIDSQLKLATSGFGSFGQATDDVRRIAAETRSGLEETASLYGNFARGAKELGASQAEAARATETFSKTLKISGADANQAASATLQFGQALASGALRGDELNSILEASPRLAKLLAESMGQPIGKIKEMGEAGQLTSDKLLRALTDTKFTESIDAEFQQMPVTFSEAMTQVSNAAIITFGAFDRGGEFSTILANFVTDGAGGFQDLEQAAEEMGAAIRGQLAGLAAAFEPVIQGARDLIAAMKQASEFGGEAQGSKEFLRGTADDLFRWSGGDGVIGRASKRFIDRDNATRARLATDRRTRELEDQMGRAGLGGSVADFLKPVAAPRRFTSAGTKAGGRKKAGPSAETLERRAEQERIKAIRDDASQQRESARLNDDILAAKAALATATQDVLQFQLDAIESERAQRVADIETEVKLGKLGREEADRRILINSELAGLQGELVKRRAAEAQANIDAAAVRDRTSTLQAEAQLLDSREARRDVELRILDLAYQEEEAAIRRAHANGDIADLDEALANLRRRQVAAKEGVNRDAEGPLARYGRELNNPDRVNDEVESAVVGELQAVRDSISSAVQKALGIENPILAALVNSFIEQQLIKPLMDALSGVEGGGGGLLGGLISGVGSIFGFASGGSMQIGGRGGNDNNTLSLNGRPIANVERGETLNIGRKALSGRGGGTTVISSPQFDLRGAVMTPQLYADMERISRANAAEAGQKSYHQSMRDAPVAVRNADRYGR